MPKTNQELYPLSGTVLRIFPPEYGTSNGRKWVRNKFILKTLEGKDIYITKFGEFSRELVGKDVTFEASQYNETNYTVQGDIVDAGDLVNELPTPAPVTQAPPTATEAVQAATTARRRGRPAAQKVTAEAKAEDAEVVGDELELAARAIVVNNLKKAETVLISLHRKDYTTTDIISVGDMLGRTYVSLKIEAGKDRRMDSFRR